MNESDLPPDPEAVVDALRSCRQVLCDLLRTVIPMGVTDHGACMVISAIDEFGAVLTGQAEPFAIGGTVGPERAAAIRAHAARIADKALEA